MKKILTLFLLSFFIFPVLASAQNSTKGAGTSNSKIGARSVSQEIGDANNMGAGLQEQERAQTRLQSQGTSTAVQLRQEIQLRAKNIDELKELIKNRKNEANAELKELKSTVQKKVYQNQNKIRLAVHALLATEGLVGGIGKQISEIARDFNNSVDATIKAEEKIQAKNKFKHFLFGGDKEAAAAIREQIEENLPKIEQLKELYNECDCSDEVKTVLQEQIDNLEQEQVRLSDLANKEIVSNGILGWVLKLFK